MSPDIEASSFRDRRGVSPPRKLDLHCLSGRARARARAREIANYATIIGWRDCRLDITIKRQSTVIDPRAGFAPNCNLPPPSISPSLKFTLAQIATSKSQHGISGIRTFPRRFKILQINFLPLDLGSWKLFQIRASIDAFVTIKC